MGNLNLTRRQALGAALGLTAAGCATASSASTDATFDHGVASGDPLSDRLILWTRATPASDDGRAIAVRWEIAEDADFTAIVAQGEATAQPARDYCVKVDAGGLKSGRSYHYRFHAGETVSPAGRATTLPEGRLDSLKLAVFSCSNRPFGRFHAYRDMAERGDIDVAVHLGDYIYEYGGPGSWGQDIGIANGHAHQPAHELITLDDYRTRYRQYRTDADLQAAHAATVWIVTWDDHEIANNPWKDGAANHNQGEGAWEDRKANAMRAWFEWLPVREPEPGRAREAIWRSFAFGDLMTHDVTPTLARVK